MDAATAAAAHTATATVPIPPADPTSITVLIATSATTADAAAVCRPAVVGPTTPERAYAHARLRAEAARQCGLSPSAIRIGHEPAGRPVLLGDSTLQLPLPHVAISHGRGVVALALSADGPVGVDVEVVRRIPGTPIALARRWFTSIDADWLAGLPASTRSEAFLWLWTQKEAIGKARGTGLRAGGMRQPVRLPPTWPLPPTADPAFHRVPGTPEICVATPFVAPRLILSVAVTTAVATSRSDLSLTVAHDSVEFTK